MMDKVQDVLDLIDAGLVSAEGQSGPTPKRRHAYNCTCFRCEDVHEPIVVAPRHF